MTCIPCPKDYVTSSYLYLSVIELNDNDISFKEAFL